MKRPSSRHGLSWSRTTPAICLVVDNGQYQGVHDPAPCQNTYPDGPTGLREEIRDAQMFRVDRVENSGADGNFAEITEPPATGQVKGISMTPSLINPDELPSSS